MPTWNVILEELAIAGQSDPNAIDTVRRRYLSQLAQYTNRPTIAYYSGWLQKPNAPAIELNDEDKNGFMACVHGLPKDRGVDLLIHSPGGGLAATESIIHYIKSIFGNNLRAIVPQIAMSAGTILACACKSILLGKQSNLGPTDPQVDGLPAFATTKEFEKAYKQIIADPNASFAWEPILKQLRPSFLQQCDYAMLWTRQYVEQCLRSNMLNGDGEIDQKVKQILDRLLDLGNNKAHNKHFHIDDLVGTGLVIERLEDDQGLQDAVLSVHHCFMHTFSMTRASKVIENSMGVAFIKQVAEVPSITFGLGGPP
ncbi:MAG: S49 family peptidase [Rhodobacter sp.]|nr:S49 family peptidase [Rhodobacter sp.]